MAFKSLKNIEMLTKILGVIWK